MRERIRSNGFATARDWRAAARADRAARAESLTLPSGTTIRAARPDPLEWIVSGRIPQGLLRVVLEDQADSEGSDRELSREEIVELARFAARLVEASVVDPPIGEGPGAISLRDRAYIFEWACRALGGQNGSEGRARAAQNSNQEELSSDKLESFRPK